MSKFAKGSETIDTLAARLRQMAQGRDTLDVASLEFVDLDPIRAAYGDAWPENKVRIEGVAEAFLRRRIDAGDLLINANGGFLVVFGTASGAAAHAAAGSLSHGLNEFFLGDLRESPAPRFGATSHAMPVKELETALGEVEFVAAETAPAVEPFSLQAIEWRYQPVLDVRRETLSSWYVTPYSRKTGERLPGYQFENGTADATQFAPIDEASLFFSEQMLHEAIPQGRQMLVGASLHVRSLLNLATRAKLLGVIDRLNRDYFRYRILKIAGVTPGFPRLYLDEIVGLLKSRIPNVVIGAVWDEPDIAGLMQSGPVAVGVTLPRSVLGVSAAVPAQNVMRKISADCKIAHAAPMRFFVEGQIDQAFAVKLVGAGVDNITSPRIWPAAGVPAGMVKWPLSRLAA